MVLAGTAVLLRLFTRFFLVWGLGSDDWVIVVAAVCDIEINGDEWEVTGL